jgi:Tol biopolymer transport system component
MNKGHNLILLITILLLSSCTGSVTKFTEKDTLPFLFPDYKEAVIPVNIAPLNFRLNEQAERLHVTIEGKSGKIDIRGKDKIKIPMKAWHELLKNNSGGSLTVTVFARKDNQWNRYLPFSIHIKNDPVDPWLAYRLIAPGYESWSEMGIYQRNLSTFDEEPIIDNRLLTGNCMNCHSFRANNPEEMVFHLRGNIGATILVKDGEVFKLDTKTDETISNCVYPYWHPSGDYIAFSVNNISQVFHSQKDKRIEVIDSRSDLVVYNITSNKLITSMLISQEDSFETFPTFTPDGKWLVFCSAEKGSMPDDYNRIKYSLCKISFDPSTGNFGNQVDTLVSSHQTGRSVSFPRISPDGKYLIFTLSDYGNFSIWHREADLYQLDLSSGDFSPVDLINSDDTESYHSWSSDSHWLVFSSRRIDGLYTRPYLAYVDESGQFSKPFLLPQKDPDYYDMSLRSFNVPELLTGKVRSDGRTMLRAIGSSAKNVTFELKD